VYQKVILFSDGGGWCNGRGACMLPPRPLGT